MTAGLAAAALLLAFLFHLGVAAVALAILATVPALYLAWKALPTGPLRHPVGVDLMLIGLRMAGAEDAVRVLANRAANAGMFYALLRTYPDEAASYRYGREPDGTPAQPWRWQETGGDP